MAAPVEAQTSSESDEIEEEIDVLSPNFNPLKALYSSKTCLPVADVSCFNNIAEYESYMSKSERSAGKGNQEEAQQKVQNQGQGSLPGKTSSIVGLSKRELERIHKERLIKQKELPKSSHLQKKRNVTNVLTHMKDATVGPLDLLRQCIEKRCKIRVCIRSFKGLRSVCIGYLVAYDKMLNLALMDVDEIYKRPSTGKRFHHEETITYSMLMANLNPQKKEASKPPSSRPNTKPQDTPAQDKKDCPFCRIIEETIQEQEVAMETKSSSSDTDSGSWNSDDDTDKSSSFSTTDTSSFDSEEQMAKGKLKSGKGTTSRSNRVQSESCPNGHRTVESSSRRDPVGKESKKTVEESCMKKPEGKGRLIKEKPETVSISDAKETRSSKTPITEPVVPANTEVTSMSRKPGTKPTTPGVSSHDAALSATFQHMLRLDCKAHKKAATTKKEPENKRQDEGGGKRVKEKVRLDGKGRRLIQPEEFKRRHVNQLFIRGDNVVLISVDSEMVKIEFKKPDEEEKM